MPRTRHPYLMGRRCTRCQCWKGVDAFYRSATGSGIGARCRACLSDEAMAWQTNNPEKAREHARAHNKRRAPLRREYMREYQLRYYHERLKHDPNFVAHKAAYDRTRRHRMTTQKLYPNISFRAGKLEPEFIARAGDNPKAFHETAQRDLARYYAMLQRSLPTFSESEASLIVDALNGTLTEPHTAHLLWAEIEDACRLDDLVEKWNLDGTGLFLRLRQMTPFEQLAIADAAERFWQLVSGGEAREIVELLREVGLTRT